MPIICSLAFRVLTTTFIPCISAPCKAAFFHVATYPFSLWSPEVSAFYLVALFSCPDPSFGPQLVSAPCEAVFIPTQQGLAQPLVVVRRLHARPRHAMAAIRPGHQCLRCCNGGFISPTSRPNAGSAHGNGKCSAYDRRRSPQCLRVRLPVCVAFTTVPASPRASGNTGDTGTLATADAPPPQDFSVSPARLVLSFAPQCSPSAGELFSGCASASVVGRIHPHFVAITHCHLIAPPWQCTPPLCHRPPPLRCHHTPPSHHHHRCRHCGHQHYGAMQ